MAPKSKRGREKSDFDADKFVSSRAQDRYVDALQSRKLIPERVFSKPGEIIEEMITRRNWEYYCCFSAVAVVSVVREFYANLPAEEENQVMVRRQEVNFSSGAINTFFGLPPDMFCFYANYHPSEGELDEIMQFLTDGRGLWKITNDRRVNFPASKLNAISKAWHYFISSKLLPSSHTSEVTRERAVLNHCIQQGKPIDIGAIIYDYISNCARATTTAGMGFPSLIHSLCERSGVKFETWEEVLQPLRPITSVNVDAYTVHSEFGWRGGFGRASTASASASAASSSRATTSRASSSTDKQIGLLKKILKKVNLTREHVRDIDGKGDNLERYIIKKDEYEENYQLYIDRLIRGDMSAEMPPHPFYIPYVPSRDWNEQDDDDDDDEDDE